MSVAYVDDDALCCLSVANQNLRQRRDYLDVRLWEVSGSTINTALEPVFVNFVQQRNNIVFLLKTS